MVRWLAGWGVAGGGKLSILPRDRTQFKISISDQQCGGGAKLEDKNIFGSLQIFSHQIPNLKSQCPNIFVAFRASDKLGVNKHTVMHN